MPLRVVESRTKTILKQIIYSFFIKIVSVVINFLYIPLLLALFASKEEYGIWLTVSSIVTWFAIFDIGLGNGLRNKLTESIANKDYLKAKKFISTTYFTSIVIFSCLGILFFITNQFLNWQVILNTNLEAGYLLHFTNVVFGIFFIRFILQLIGVVYLSFQNPAMNNLIVTIGNLIGLIALLLIKDFFSLDLVSCAYILMGIPVFFMLIVSVYAFSTKFRNISPSISYFDKKLLNGLFSLGISFFIIQVSAVLLFSSSNILISHFFSPEDVVIYNTAFTLFQLPTLAYGIVMGPIWSAVTDALAKDDMIWLKEGMKKLNMLSIVFFVGIILLLLISPFIYKIWLKDKMEIPFLLSFSMALYASISVLLSPYTSFINGSGKIQISVLFSLVSIFIFFPIALLLSKSINSPAAIMISICIVNSIGFFLQPKQVYKIINKKAIGIWNK